MVDSLIYWLAGLFFKHNLFERDRVGKPNIPEVRFPAIGSERLRTVLSSMRPVWLADRNSDHTDIAQISSKFGQDIFKLDHSGVLMMGGRTSMRCKRIWQCRACRDRVSTNSRFSVVVP